MNITINGNPTIVKEETNPITLAKVIKDSEYHPQLIVIEFNGTILAPEKWGNQIVREGDNLEIVTIVGGGS